ncbi:hypothetical protein ACQR2Y_12970 [Clostridium perfringens]
MSGKVNTSPEILREFAQEIEMFIGGQEEIVGRLNTSYSNIGSEWDDVQYHKFGECIQNIISRIKEIIPECEETIIHLRRKADVLEDYYN